MHQPEQQRRHRIDGEREQQEEAVAGLGPEAQEEQHRHAGTETLSGFRIECIASLSGRSQPDIR